MCVHRLHTHATQNITSQLHYGGASQASHLLSSQLHGCTSGALSSKPQRDVGVWDLGPLPTPEVHFSPDPKSQHTAHAHVQMQIQKGCGKGCGKRPATIRASRDGPESVPRRLKVSRDGSVPRRSRLSKDGQMCPETLKSVLGRQVSQDGPERPETVAGVPRRSKAS